MIDPLAIKEWLESPRRDSAKAKRFTARALRAKVDALDPRPEFVLEPFAHQLACFLLCAKYPGYTLHLDMGTGKTKVMIDSFRWRKTRGEAARLLVLVPSTSNVDEWGRQLDTHGPELSRVLFDRSMGPQKRDDAFWDPASADVLVMTYVGLVRLLTKPGGGGRRAPDDAKIRKVGTVVDMLVCDESTAVKNAQSVVFRILRRFVTRVPFRYCLSGTPANMSMEDLWSQFYVADGGQTLGKTLGWYRQAFFREVEGPFRREHHIRERMIPKLHQVLRHGAVRYEDAECQDLPDTIGGIADPMIRAVPMSVAQGRRAAGYREEMLAAVRDEDTETVVNTYYQMRCLSSGYVPTEQGFHDFAENPKLDALLQLLEEGGAHQWLVFYHYQHSADLMGAELRSKGVDFVEVSGRVSNKANALRKFRTGSARVMLGSGAAALGLNLQHCSRTVYFESPDSIAVRRQSEKRTHRHGQVVTARFYDLVVRGTFDGKIIEALRQGKKVLDAVVDGRELC